MRLEEVVGRDWLTGTKLIIAISSDFLLYSRMTIVSNKVSYVSNIEERVLKVLSTKK
jgi:hypothetical protein